jgi:hypothetical protein
MARVAFVAAVVVLLAIAGISSLVFFRVQSLSKTTTNSVTTVYSTDYVPVGSTSSSSTSLATVSSGLDGLTLGQFNTTVPAKYASQISSVQSILNSFNASIGPQPSLPNKMVFAAELLPANCNRGPDLLKPAAIDGVSVNLKALKAMGVQGVVVCIGYPLLDPSFPNSSLYLAFYEQVSATVHSYGMKLLVECGDLFANTPYSPLTFDWSKLTYQQYVKGHDAQYQLIIDKVKPDYLEMGVEADTEALLTGFSQLDTASGWTAYIEQALSAINKSGTTKLAAGAATWLGIQFMQGFASNPRLDFVSTHIYPIYGNNLRTLVQMGELAKQDNKRLVIDEAWEQKVLSNPNPPGGGVGGPATTAQEVFGYSAPVDEQFLQLMARFGQTYPVEFFSPWSELYFFAYLNWTPSLDPLGYFQLNAMLTPLASQDMQTLTVTPTGLTYAELALGDG